MTERELYQKFKEGEISEEDVLKQIKRNSEEDFIKYPLSEGQKGIWYAHYGNPQNTGYHIAGAYFVSKMLDSHLLEEALNMLALKHSALRKTFIYEDGEVFQRVCKNVHIPIQSIKLSEDDYLRQLDRFVRVSFHLEREVPVRVYLADWKEDKKILLLVVHHLIFDLLSSYIFWNELCICYEALKEGRKLYQHNYTDLYKSYVADEKEYMQSEKARSDRRYWIAKLAVANQQKSSVKTRLVMRQEDFECHKMFFNNEELEQHKTGSITPSSFFMSIFRLALSITRNLRNPIIGFPVSLRQQERYCNTIGYFVNMIMISQLISNKESFFEYMKLTQEEVLEGLQHSEYPYHELTKEIHKYMNFTGELFDAAFYYQDYCQYSHSKEFLYPLTELHQMGEFPLVLLVIRTEEGFQISINYHTDLYSKIDAQHLIDQMHLLINTFFMTPDISLEHLLEHWAEKKAALLPLLSDMKKLSGDSFLSMFLEQVKLTPLNTAVIFKEESLSYELLSIKVCKLSGYLIKRGLHKGDFVGVLIERSIDMLVATLAIQLSGGIYLPLDPSYPPERLEYMVKESAARMVILHHKTQKIMKTTAIPINMDELRKDIEGQELQKEFIHSLCSVEGRDSAYIIYTSGSTGAPKGILIQHNSLVNFLESMKMIPGCNENDHMLALTTICFDISLLELLLPLITGAVLEILPEEIAKDGIRLQKKLLDETITIMQATPSTWQMLLAAGWQGNKKMKILIGGEAFSKELVEELLACGKECWNLYGPTETTIWSSVCKLEENKEISIGLPINNTTLYLVNDKGKPVMNSEIGEIYIGGAGLAKGYLNKPEETSLRFIQLPAVTGDSSMVYKTGDLGKYLPDGTIQYIGRNDQQVKFHGYRIELGEINSILNTLDEISDVRVVLRGTKNSEMLIAFLLKKPEQPILNKNQIIGKIKDRLPSYMIPGEFIYLRNYPMTDNRKINSTKLREMPLRQLIKTYGILEQEREPVILDKVCLVEFMKEAIGRMKDAPSKEIDTKKAMGDYGFDSVSFTQLSYQINQNFGLDINATLFYTYPSINEISEYIIKNYCENTSATELNIMIEPAKKSAQDIAIIGIGGFLPASKSIEDFWKYLLDTQCVITEVPDTRWNYAEYYDSNNQEVNKGNSKWGGFLNEIDIFDSALFGISPKEAERMDPQQRLMLMAVWTAIENAGYKPSELSDSDTGVYIGATGSDYAHLLLRDMDITPHTISGMVNAVIANRVSYFYNLHGPSEVIDTACSGGLTAFCHAVQAIQNGQCEMAIAGSVNLLISPEVQVALSKTGMLSNDGLCKTFDKTANGYVRGEGCISFILKRLSQAVEDKDHVYAVVKGTAINHGGKSNSLTAPNGASQTELIKKAVKGAGINPYKIAYIETHGTGTALGDPIEINALKQAFNEMFHEWDEGKGQPVPCGLGSVKTNIGHLEAASGLAGLLKTIYSLHKKIIPASLHCKQLNPYIDLKNSHLYIVNENQDINKLKEEHQLSVLYAGVSSFGFGGTNAHVLLEEYENDKNRTKSCEKAIFILSASNKKVLYLYVNRWIEFLKDNKEQFNLLQAAYVLQTGREEMAVRLAIIAETREELLDKLTRFASEEADIAALYCGIIGEEADSLSRDRIIKDSEADFDAIAQTWVKGGHILWKYLYDKRTPNRIPLPTYPFSKQHYWITKQNHMQEKVPFQTDIVSVEEVSKAQAEEKTIYKKIFSPLMPILKEHRVQNKCILPAAGYLDMVFEGIRAIGWKQDVKLSDIAWLLPFSSTKDDEEIFYIVFCKEQYGLMFQVESKSGFGNITHCKGKVMNKDVIEESFTFIPDEIIKRTDLRLDGEECYRVFEREVELVYGPYFQGIQEVFYNQQEAIGRVVLPEACNEIIGKNSIHPVIMDCAMQIVSFLFEDRKQMRVPYSVKNIIIYKTEITDIVYCYAFKNAHNEYDIFLLDQNGSAYVEFQSYQVKESNFIPASQVKDSYQLTWEKFSPKPGKRSEESGRRILILHNGETEGLLQVFKSSMKKCDITVIKIGGHLQDDNELLYNDSSGYVEVIERYSIDTIYFLASVSPYLEPEVDTIKERQKDGIYAFLALVKSLDGVCRKLQLFVFTNYSFPVKEQMSNPVHSGMRGMVKSAIREYPNIDIRHVDIEWYKEIDYKSCETLIQKYFELLLDNEWNEIAIRNQEYYIQQVVKSPVIASKDSIIRKNGIYIIIGAGGIAAEVVRYLSGSGAAQLILVGRSDIEQTKKRELESLNKEKIGYTYIQADITNFNEMDRLFIYLEQKYGKIHGVFHCAMVLKDIRMKNMSEKVLEEVIAPKMYGSLNLYKLASTRTLDFIFFFSSVNAFLGNSGQGNYSAASSFMDSFAYYCSRNLNTTIKLLNSSSWGETGKVANEKFSRQLAKEGIIPISTKEGISVVDLLLKSEQQNYVLFKGQDKICQEIRVFQDKPCIEKDDSEYAKLILVKKSFQKLEKLAFFMLVDFFRQFGNLITVGQTISMDILFKELKIHPQYKQLFRALIQIMEAERVIVVNDKTIRVTEVFDSIKGEVDIIKESCEVFEAENRELAPFLKLLRACLVHYKDILNGSMSYTEVMFPKGSKQLVSDIYKGNPLMDYYNDKIALVIRDYILEKVGTGCDSKLKILEIGAGTGGTSKKVLSEMNGLYDYITYYYTDISRSFLKEAEENFRNYDCISYKILDIEQLPVEEEFKAESFDVVLASNVLHATTNISVGLYHISHLLKKNGICVINEMTKFQYFTTVTFGLTSGWWLYKDKSRMSNAPLLTVSSWERVLSDAGFLINNQISIEKETENIEQCIFTARKIN